MLSGREFNDADERSLMEPTPGNATRMLPVVINETAAKKLFGSTNAIGKHLKDRKPRLRSSRRRARSQERHGHQAGNRLRGPVAR
jgi:hypothetical protein